MAGMPSEIDRMGRVSAGAVSALPTAELCIGEAVSRRIRSRHLRAIAALGYALALLVFLAGLAFAPTLRAFSQGAGRIRRVPAPSAAPGRDLPTDLQT